MKRLLCLIILLSAFSGCGNNENEMKFILSFRQHLLGGNGCSFSAEITADYGEEIYWFTVLCQGDKQGNLTFTVAKPDNISGICGLVTDLGGSLTFDETVLSFPPIADGQITPVVAPWIFLKTLRSGYIASCTKADWMLSLQIDAGYHEKALHLDIWFDESGSPARGEILWEGRRILSLIVRDFTIL